MTQPVFTMNLQGMLDSNMNKPGSSRRSRFIHRHDMDMVAAAQYWNFYNYSHEPLLRACRAHRTDATFKGPVEVYWGGGEMDPVRLDGPGEEASLKDLFRTALIWRDVFGMVPVMFQRRAKRRKHANILLATIPPFGTGKFITEFNSKDMTMKVVYEILINDKVSGLQAGANRMNRTAAAVTRHGRVMTSKGQADNVQELDVFVWPEMLPDFATGNFHSRVQALLGPFARISALRENLLVADRSQARPVIFTQSRPEVSGVERQTEQELLGGIGDPGVLSSIERRHYLRDTHRAIRQEQLTAAANAGARGVVNVALNPRATRLINASESAWAGSVEPLPDGEMMTRPVMPSSRPDIGKFEETYAEAVCTAMGVPYGILRGVGSARIKGETDVMMQVFRSSVERDRAEIEMFYQWVHEKLWRDNDNEYLAVALLASEDAEKLAQSATEVQRQRDVRANITAISQMANRVTVVFPENPLPRGVDLAVLETAASTGAISIGEQVNLLRGQLGLKNVDSEHGLLQAVDAYEAPIADLQTHSPGTGNASGVGIIFPEPVPSAAASASAPTPTRTQTKRKSSTPEKKKAAAAVTTKETAPAQTRSATKRSRNT
jgi:hypothetical protein